MAEGSSPIAAAAASGVEVNSPQPAGPRGASPPPSPVLPVPVITPRYQKKSRSANAISISDEAGALTSIRGFTASDWLRMRSVEALTVRSGAHTHEESVRYHAYAMFRHGTGQYHSSSVGYSSDGDLVVFKDEVTSSSDTELSLQRRSASIRDAVCLNPKARRPLTEAEEAMKSEGKSVPKNPKKYPGVRCPRNRRTRNRLRNDHLLGECMASLARVGSDDSSSSVSTDDETPSFAAVLQSPALPKLLHKSLDAQERLMDKLGISPTLRPAADPRADPNTPSARFQLLANRLKSEVQHALSSEYMTGFIRQLELDFLKLIEGLLVGPITLRLQDGYNRLICHAVAAYYKLVSTSQDSVDGGRLTVVSLPKARPALPGDTLLGYLGCRHGLDDGEERVLHPLARSTRKKAKRSLVK